MVCGGSRVSACGALASWWEVPFPSGEPADLVALPAHVTAAGLVVLDEEGTAFEFVNFSPQDRLGEQFLVPHLFNEAYLGRFRELILIEVVKDLQHFHEPNFDKADFKRTLADFRALLILFENCISCAPRVQRQISSGNIS